MLKIGFPAYSLFCRVLLFGPIWNYNPLDKKLGFSRCASIGIPMGIPMTQTEIHHETYPEKRSRADNRRIRLQIALRVFLVPEGVPEVGQCSPLHESLEFYRSESTFSISLCLVGKLLVNPARVVCAPWSTPISHMRPNSNIRPKFNILLFVLYISY